MNHYECLSIVSGKCADTEIESVVQLLEQSVQKHALKIHYIQRLERRKLAYPIDHVMYGTYVLFEFDAEPPNITKIDRFLRLTNEILRHIIVKRESVGSAVRSLDIVRDEGREERRTMPTQKYGASELESLVPLKLDEVDEHQESEVKKDETTNIQDPIEQPKQEFPATASEEEDQGASKKSDKSGKQTKLSYDDLDKKLDEILGKDII